MAIFAPCAAVSRGDRRAELRRGGNAREAEIGSRSNRCELVPEVRKGHRWERNDDGDVFDACSTSSGEQLLLGLLLDLCMKPGRFHGRRHRCSNRLQWATTETPIPRPGAAMRGAAGVDRPHWRPQPSRERPFDSGIFSESHGMAWHDQSLEGCGCRLLGTTATTQSNGPHDAWRWTSTAGQGDASLVLGTINVHSMGICEGTTSSGSETTRYTCAPPDLAEALLWPRSHFAEAGV